MDNTSDCQTDRPRIEPHRRLKMSNTFIHKIPWVPIQVAVQRKKMKDKRYNSSIKNISVFESVHKTSSEHFKRRLQNIYNRRLQDRYATVI